MIKYKIVAGPAIRVNVDGSNSLGSHVSDVHCEELNVFTGEGWELVQTITHRSDRCDGTAVAFLLKKEE